MYRIDLQETAGTRPTSAHSGESSDNIAFAASSVLAAGAMVLCARGKALSSLARAVGTPRGFRAAADVIPESERGGLNLLSENLNGVGTATSIKPELTASLVESDAAALQPRPAVWTGPKIDFGNEHLTNEQYYARYVDEMPITTKPEYMDSGHLSPGKYRLSYGQFASEFGYNQRRQDLLSNLTDVLRSLKSSGVGEVHIGGSFVTKKVRPGDIDMTWDRNVATHDTTLLRELDSRLAFHRPWQLKDMGIDMLTEPPVGGSYKGMQYFLAHHQVPYEAMRRGMRRTVYRSEPNGLVELDLSSLPEAADK